MYIRGFRLEFKLFYYAAEGDVWGLDNGVIDYKGFKVGDKVFIIGKKAIKKIGKKQGTIKSLIDDRYCLVEIEGDLKKLEYKDITKIK